MEKLTTKFSRDLLARIFYDNNLHEYRNFYSKFLGKTFKNNILLLTSRKSDGNQFVSRFRHDFLHFFLSTTVDKSVTCKIFALLFSRRKFFWHIHKFLFTPICVKVSGILFRAQRIEHHFSFSSKYNTLFFIIVY